jgi:hypothetical protein
MQLMIADTFACTLPVRSRPRPALPLKRLIISSKTRFSEGCGQINYPTKDATDPQFDAWLKEVSESGESFYVTVGRQPAEQEELEDVIKNLVVSE